MKWFVLAITCAVLSTSLAEAKLSPKQVQKLSKRVADTHEAIEQKKESLSIKYRQLEAANNVVAADRKFGEVEPDKSGGGFDENHAERTNHHLRHLEVDTLKAEIRQLKREISDLESQSRKLSRKIQRR